MSARHDDLVTFTTIENTRGLLTKSIRPNGQGGIVKTPAAQLVEGIAETTEIPFSELGQYLRSLQPNQAIAHGVTGRRRPRILSEYRYKTVLSSLTGNDLVKFQAETITRTQKFFHYNEGPGLGMFDHDPKPGHPALNPDEFISAICEVWPDFRSLPTVYTPSTSSCIYDLAGNQLTGMGAGFHLYFLFPHAHRLPDLAKWLFHRLWLTGHGSIFISASGAMLERTIFDASVFSAERLDFVAGAVCHECEQRLPAPEYRPGSVEVAV